MRFTTDNQFNSSHKMGVAMMTTVEKAIVKFPYYDDSDCDGKVEFYWSGSFTARDGSVHRAAFWDWKGSLRNGYGVSVWIDNPNYLPEFIKFIEVP